MYRTYADVHNAVSYFIVTAERAFRLSGGTCVTGASEADVLFDLHCQLAHASEMGSIITLQ